MLYKKCSKCGAQIPKEAGFCLKCFSSLEAISPQPEGKNPSVFFLFWTRLLKILKARSFRWSLVGVAGLLTAMGICIFLFKTANTTPSPVVPETTIIHITETVAVTQSNGEFVTEENGEQVFDVVEHTQTITLPPSTTKIQGLLGGLFNDKTTSPKQTTSVNTDKDDEETTQKGFWENLFDKDDTTESTIVTTTKPEATSSVTATTIEATTSPNTTLPPTTAGTVSTKDFEYTISGKYATITKYTGNASSVIIPAVIEGCAVTKINGNTFQNNSSIVTVSFETNSKQPYLWVNSQTFNNCPNLRFINFSDTDLGILNNFAMNCPSMEDISVSGSQFKCIDGTLYYNTGSTWKVRYHCPANPATELRLPNNCAGFESAINLKEARNIKNIYMGKNVTSYPAANQMPPNCENIFVDSGNPNGYDVGGVAFFKQNGGYLCLYPPKNKTQSLTLPENTLIYCNYFTNSSLKTLYIPSTANVQYLEYVLSKKTFSSLENLYFGSAHSKAAYVLEHSDITNTQLY